MGPGPRNLITDVAGLTVGHAEDEALRSGVTVLLPEAPVVAAVDVRGGGPGTRETDALDPAIGTVGEIHGLVLSGGSAFGLDAASGAQSYLRALGRGFQIHDVRVPIVPTAILFDLLNGGNKDWGRHPPYRDLAERACATASADFALGTTGAGFGATTARLKGGLGSASWIGEDGLIVGALAAVNPAGCVSVGDTSHFWAAPLEWNSEFGGLGWPEPLPAEANLPRTKGRPGENTTLAVVATNANLNRAQAKRLAITAQSGLARAIYPIHTPLDGDVVFALATGEAQAPEPLWGLARLGALAANTLARAVARAVFEASAFPGTPPGPPAHRDL